MSNCEYNGIELLIPGITGSIDPINQLKSMITSNTSHSFEGADEDNIMNENFQLKNGFIKYAKTMSDEEVNDLTHVNVVEDGSGVRYSINSSGTYAITTKEELIALRNYTNIYGGASGAGGTMTFILGADIDLSGED